MTDEDRLRDEVPYEVDSLIAANLREMAEVDSVQWDPDRRALVVVSEIGAPIMHLELEQCHRHNALMQPLESTFDMSEDTRTTVFRVKD